MSLDKSKVLKGSDIVINDYLKMKQPSVGEIVDFGEEKFLSTFYSLCSIPSDMKSILWDMGIDWNKLSDFELFVSLSRQATAENTCLIFGELDFSQMVPMPDANGNIVLASSQAIITEDTYNEMINNLREMVGYPLKREKAANKATKLAMIEEDRINRSSPKRGNQDSFIYSAIITLVNTEEFPYTYKSVMDITIYQLMKSYYQVQNKKAACALYQGSMSGFMDASKIDKKAFQWIYTNDKKS